MHPLLLALPCCCETPDRCIACRIPLDYPSVTVTVSGWTPPWLGCKEITFSGLSERRYLTWYDVAGSVNGTFDLAYVGTAEFDYATTITASPWGLACGPSASCGVAPHTVAEGITIGVRILPQNTFGEPCRNIKWSARARGSNTTVGSSCLFDPAFDGHQDMWRQRGPGGGTVYAQLESGACGGTRDSRIDDVGLNGSNWDSQSFPGARTRYYRTGSMTMTMNEAV